MAKPRISRKPQETHKTESKDLQKPEKSSSWTVVRSFLSFKHLQTPEQQPLEPDNKQQKQQKQQNQKQKQQQEQVAVVEESSRKCKKMKCSGSLCSNTKVMQKPSEVVTPEALKRRSSMGSFSGSSNNTNHSSSSSRSMKVPLQELNGVVPSATSSSLSVSSNGSSFGGSLRGMPFRRFSGCYECRMVVDPVLGFTRDPSLRSTICSCPDCGEIFMKPDNLELHLAVRHAVSELGPEDTSKNIVEIIFQSSWLKKQTPVCKIDRILKVHNTQKTISKFEEYRDSIKAKATKKNPRCIADGNELLRFHCTMFSCSLGLDGSSNLCNSIPQCNVCNIIRNGFKVGEEGILTTATSGRAHDNASLVMKTEDDETRAMLVCRVIAGRVKKNMEGSMEEYDSAAGACGLYSNLDELYVFNPRAILPCFVVIYRGY
ncbi:hypothetical protein ACJRO7_025579 [Eucalyptus globulus]|uniref:C2H2-type domain-containing protein n=1 Tax=Eucalyptus globulus TaxID=34317 RepID=A0ABD3KHY1_EUCGL